MKEIPLHDAKNRLSALVSEVEGTGGEIVITRHGTPAARLVPVNPPDDRAKRAAVGALLIENLERRAEEHPESAEVVSWEDLKRESDLDRL